MLFAGREDERGALRRVARAAAVGAGGAVLVVGDAGIGKSALLDAAASDTDLRVLRGRAWEEGGAPPYWPWREVAVAGGWSVRWDAEDELTVLAAVVEQLRSSAAETPLLVTLDDLHAADEGTLRLTRYAARAAADAPVALVLASRPSDRVLPLHRHADVIELGPLDAETSAGLVDLYAARGLPAEARAVLTERAGGNPLFLRELARAADGDRLPAGVQATVADRLRGLAAATRSALEAAAVLGREVDGGALATLTGQSPGELLDALRPAADEGLLRAEPTGRWRWTHDLLREAVEAGLGPRERAELHVRAAGVAGVRERASAVARHLLAAVPVASPEDAVEAARDAADEADRAGSPGEAVALLRRASPLVTAPQERLGWLLRLGGTALRDGQVAVSHDAYEEAVGLARRVDVPHALAEAVLGRTARLMTEDGILAHVPLLDEALARARDQQASADVVRLTARRAVLLIGSDPVAARAEAEAAVVLAADDDTVLWDALSALHVTCWGPAEIARAGEVSARLLEVAERTGDGDRRVEALVARMVDHLRTADLAAVDLDLAELVRVADATGQPRHRYFALSRLATRAFLVGRVAEGELFSEQARQLGVQIEEPDADQVFYGSRVCVLPHLYDRQRLEEIAAWFDTVIAPLAPTAGWFGATIHTALGRSDLGVAYIRRSVAATPDAFVPGRLPLMELCLAAQVAVAARDAHLAADVERALQPWGGQIAVNAGAVSVAGLVDQHLGQLAAVQGRVEEGRALLEKVAVRYRDLGAVLLLGDVQAALAELGATTDPDRDGPRRGVLRRTADGWEAGFAERTALLPDARGLQHLAVLLARPGQDVPAAALVSPESASMAAAEARDALLDETAKRAYRGRITELRAVLDRADASDDPDASARAQAELDALVSELRRAVGLGGRDRTAAGAEERARVAVRKAVTAAVDRLAQHDPRFAHLLRSTVRTGRTCAYVPDPNVLVDWVLD